MTPVLLIAILLFPGQATPPPARETFYVESWKHGKRQIKEGKIDIKLSLTQPNFGATLKDSSGKTPYKFSVSLVQSRSGRGLSSVANNYWEVKLLKRAGFRSFFEDNRENLLRAFRGGYGDSPEPEDYIDVLSPICDRSVMNDDVHNCTDSVPLLARRVVKVETFYVVFQVTDYRFVQGKKLLESISLRVEFSNQYDGPRKNNVH